MTWALTVAFLATLALGIPVAFCLALSSLVFLLLSGDIPLHLIPQRMFTGMDSFPLMAVPFFILAGELMNSAGITQKIVRFSTALVGHIRGGLAHVNIVASMFFAGISGSAVADTAALGSILIPAMEKDGYSKTFSAAVTASSSVIGPIIPPSIPVVIYALVGSVSVGGLFLAGVVPGVLIGVGLMVVAYVLAKKHGYGTKQPRVSFGEFVQALWGAIIPLLMPLIILGGILSGVFTPTEAASVAVAYAVVVGLLVLRTLKLSDLPGIFYRSMLTTSTILMVMACANIFSWILGTEMIPQKVAKVITSLSENPYVLLLLINLLLFVVGCFLEGLAAIIIMVPILLPIAQHAGIDPIHFGIVVVMNLMIGLITPPLGLCLFVCCSVSKVDLVELVRANMPFLLVELATLFLVAYVPQVVLFLPRLFGY
ncbi:MAG: transporter large permease [Desulfacinum sp.]|jgi:tripartite ATP-independent transporter DctM subunit|nr:transporter large permease [Desulfacinum sp.]